MKSCCYCGEHFPDNTNFCSNCGKMLLTSLSSNIPQTPQTSTSTKSESGGNHHPLTYEQFRKRKESIRTNVLPKKAKSCKAKENDKPEVVKIQIGIKEYSEDGTLKTLKGRTLPVAVNNNINANDLLEMALAKHSKHFRSFNGNMESFVLLYPDNTVVNLLPGSSEFFSLKEYKKDLGKPYSRIYFCLCHVDCLKKFEADINSEDSLDREYENDQPKSRGSRELSPMLKHTQPIRPFLFNNHDDIPADTITCSYQSATEKNITVTCPTCYEQFPVAEIEMHADVCASQFDPIGTVNLETELEIPGDEDMNLLCFENPSQASITGNEKDNSSILQAPITGNDNASNALRQQIKETITVLRTNVDQNVNRLSIRRRYAFQDYVTARRKPRRKFNPNGMLKISFIGEPAVDDGGPRREFYSEALEQVNRRLFCNGSPVVNMAALAEEEFKIAGEIMASSIVQGGPAPCFLSSSVYAYIVNGVGSVGADDAEQIVENLHSKNAINKLRECNDDEAFKSTIMLSEVFDVLEKVGYRGVPSRETLASRDAILRSIVMFEFSSKMPMLDQMVEGLRSFGVLGCIKQNSKLLEQVFTSSATFVVNAEIFLENIVGNFSETGSNNKEVEINIFKFFCDYVEDCEDPENPAGSLPKLLQFITGTKAFPPLGFSKAMTAKFKHGCPSMCRCRPTSSTCDLSITLPVHCHGQEDFNMLMNSAVVEGVGFGNL